MENRKKVGEEWIPVSLARVDGSICELRFRDSLGYYEVPGETFFLHDDGYWYKIDPPVRVEAIVTPFPSCVCIC